MLLEDDKAIAMVEVVKLVCTLAKQDTGWDFGKYRITEPVYVEPRYDGKVKVDGETHEAGKAVQTFSNEPILQNSLFYMDLARKRRDLPLAESGIDQLEQTFIKDLNLILRFLKEGDEFQPSKDRTIVVKKNPGPGGVDLRKALSDHRVIDKERAESRGIGPGEEVVLKSSDFMTMQEYTTLHRYA